MGVPPISHLNPRLVICTPDYSSVSPISHLYPRLVICTPDLSSVPPIRHLYPRLVICTPDLSSVPPISHLYPRLVICTPEPIDPLYSIVQYSLCFHKEKVSTHPEALFPGRKREQSWHETRASGSSPPAPTRPSQPGDRSPLGGPATDRLPACELPDPSRARDPGGGYQSLKTAKPWPLMILPQVHL